MTILRGPVASGKTSVCDAIRIAALGCIPSIGRDSAAISRIIRDGQLTVRIELEDGRACQRGYERHGDRLQGLAWASWMPPASKLTQVAESIRALFGRDDREASEHLDLRQIISCTPAERARRIEELLDASGIPADELARRGRALVILRLADVEQAKIPARLDDAEAAADGVRSLLSPARVDVMRSLVPELTKQLQTAGVAVAAEYARGEKHRASEGLRQKTAARNEIEDRLEELRVPAEALEDLEKRKASALERRGAAMRDLEAEEKARKIREELEPAIPRLREKVAAAEQNLAEAQAGLPRAKQLRYDAALTEDPDPIPRPEIVEPDPDQIARADTLEAEAQEIEADPSRNGPLPERISISTEEAGYKSACSRLELAKKSPWREVEEIAERLSRFERDSPDPDIERLVELAYEHGHDVGALEAEAAKAVDALDVAQKRQASRDAEIAHKQAERAKSLHRTQELREEAKRIRRQAVAAAIDVNRAARDASTRLVNAREKAVAENRTQRNRIVGEAEALEHAASRAEADLARERAALESATERLAGIASVTADPDQARTVLDRAATEIAQLDRQIEAMRDADSLRRELTGLLEQIEEATAARDAWAAAEWACQRLRELDLAARAGGLQERMRRYLRAAGRTEEPFLRASRGQCDFGWRRDGKEISVEALSGGETALYCAILAGAIISMRGPEIRILLVEAAELGAGKESTQLLAACEEMVTVGDLDQVLIVTCQPIEPTPNWRVIHLQATAPSEGNGSSDVAEVRGKAVTA